MERRTALVASIATGVTLTMGVVAFAATGGASILGLGPRAQQAAVDPVVVHQVRTIDDQIMVPTRPTDVPRPVARTTDTPQVAAVLDPVAVNSDDGITVSIGPPSASTVAVTAATPESPAPATSAGTPNTAPASIPPASTPPASTTPASTPTASTVAATPPVSTAAPSAAPTTSAARPPGVPADWPAGTPIPPMPADCQQPQLEDNGVWNCDH